MTSERPEELSKPLPPVRRGDQSSDAGRDSIAQGDQTAAEDHVATVVLHAETVREPKPLSSQQAAPPKDKETSPPRQVSQAKVKMQSRLPLLDDHSEVGLQKDQIVIRDGKADLAFTGTLLACAAPPAAPKGQWQEYRIYETNGGKHVFSKVTRSVFAEDQDAHEAEVFDPSPSSVPTQLLRSARDLARSRPLTWMDAAVDFFGYDPLAKALYRNLGGRFEEHIA